ncbi:MAG: nucleoside permease [Bacteroidia bacterium]|nr:nucleoside permease [Bacteroidia bacterium]NND51439.1 nucleoside permease [Flavobacteriaceae bacterium]
MSIKFRLTVLNFIELFIFGTWLISLGGYLGGQLEFTGGQIGKIFMTLGIGSILMPAVIGIIADKYVNAQKLFGILHLIGAGFLIYLAQINNFDTFFWVILGYLLLYMPSLGLANAVSFSLLVDNAYDVVKEFPRIRVWGTIGFVVAMWAVDLMKWTQSPNQFYLAAGFSLLLGIYAFSLPNIPLSKAENKTLSQRLGLDALVLFKTNKMAIFFLFSMLIGIVLQISNAWASEFLRSFSNDYPDSFAVQHSNILISLSQISETVFILAIPFFLKRFGIKTVMLISMIAWFLRFGLFGIGYPEGIGLGFLILSMIVYGLAFDFFHISGALFVETETDNTYRSSAQGLFVLLTNGGGALIGGYTSGLIVDYFTKDGYRDWTSIWFVFAFYAIVLAIIFALIFKHKHKPGKIHVLKH